MSMLRINHVEFSVPPGTIARDREDIARFYGDIFGFGCVDIEIDGTDYFILAADEQGSQFIGMFESEQYLQSRSLDHMGFFYESPDEIDDFLARCREWQKTDARVEIQKYHDLVLPQTITHSFYFRFLMPIWIHVASITAREGHEKPNYWVWTGPAALPVTTRKK